MELSRHALHKLETYDIRGERLASWHQALRHGVRHIDLNTAARIMVTQW